MRVVNGYQSAMCGQQVFGQKRKSPCINRHAPVMFSIDSWSVSQVTRNLFSLSTVIMRRSYTRPCSHPPRPAAVRKRSATPRAVRAAYWLSIAVTAAVVSADTG